MIPESLVGKIVTLPICRFGPPGAFLATIPGDVSAGAPAVLLLGSEIPPDAAVGDDLTVFVYNDSEGRPLATLRTPALCLGEVTYLTATARHDRIGAFFDWGMPKDLLVPFAEQTADINVAARYPVGLIQDRAGRLVGTMRVSELLGGIGKFAPGEWVQGEAWRNDPQIGLFVIVERAFVGLVPAYEPHQLSRGEKSRFRISSILPDGRIELSLRGLAHEEIDADTQKILAVLQRQGAPRFGDPSTPGELRALFGISRKAFKRAVGRLLKEQKVSIDANGFVVSAK